MQRQGKHRIRRKTVAGTGLVSNQSGANRKSGHRLYRRESSKRQFNNGPMMSIPEKQLTRDRRRGTSDVVA